ncbi:MAG: cytochrome c family protein [Ignavibacteria bacterium]|nr:cytochrome c family protein [Ignavibacteria bacterium]
MKAHLKIFIFFLILSQFLITSFAQNHSQMKFDCSLCHACETPTKSDPCLITCPCDEMMTVHIPPVRSPKIITMHKLNVNQNLYEPVLFSHRVHAEMSEMSGGCGMCHHYNPSGNVVPCSNCHQINRNRTDISKPDLKAAYHRQCIDCHMQWSDDFSCTSCHELNESGRTAFEEKEIKEERVHPEIEVPEKLIYQTPDQKKSLVTFYHSDHTNYFDFECIDCHQEESCTSCHLKNELKSEQKISMRLKHKSCSQCHYTDEKSACTNCHIKEIAKPFNHKRRTSFELKSYHMELSCIRCHESKSVFTGLSSNCANCHSGWNLETFDHKVTGLMLDEMHADVECIDCHPGEDFSTVPSCEDCHDEKTYPDDKPGILKN